MNEGSVEVDEGSLPTTTINDDSSQDETIENRDDTQSNQEANQATDDQGEQGEDQEQRTQKGTRLDPNPLNAAHQQLANANRLVRDYQDVLLNPDKLRKYAVASGLTLAEAKAEIKEEAKALYTPEMFDSKESLAGTLNKMQTGFQTELQALREENKRLSEGFTGFSQSRYVERVASVMSQETTAVQEKYPELNSKNPGEYDPALEEGIANLFANLDAVDPKDLSQGFKGQHSLAELTDLVMGAAGKARAKGSQRAQTDIRVKEAGRVVTSSKNNSQEPTSSKDAGSVIAQRIAKAMRNA